LGREDLGLLGGLGMGFTEQAFKNMLASDLSTTLGTYWDLASIRNSSTMVAKIESEPAVKQFATWMIHCQEVPYSITAFAGDTEVSAKATDVTC